MGQTINEARLHPVHHKHNQGAKFQMAIKAVDDDEEERQQEHSVERKLFSIFYICALLVITLYVTYAAYYFHYRQPRSSHPQKQPLTPQEVLGTGSEYTRVALGAANEQRMSNEQPIGGEFAPRHMQLDLETKLESKILLLERYIQVIAVDLQDTKEKLREREKCDCSISCTFNGTRYADKSSWQYQCDTCTCQSGLISCAPQKCPKINCDVAIQLAGQCCPTCMKKCKYNDAIIKHGQKFRPPVGASARGGPTKECRCYDGVIKCEPNRAQQVVDTRGQKRIVHSNLSANNLTAAN